MPELFGRSMIALLIVSSTYLCVIFVCSMVMHWQYVSICRGGKSLLEKLAAAGINAEDYISFFSLRDYDRVNHVVKDIKKSKGRNSGDSGSATDSKKDSNSVSDNAAKNEADSKQDNTEDGSHEHEDSFSDEKSKPLVEEGINASEPVQPVAPSHAHIKQLYVTEEVYVHTKILIVDDKYVICGSGKYL
jgi:phosphatidylserine/phosphatidylglycerophosphate/cardiolipin synthase-like enzyme